MGLQSGELGGRRCGWGSRKHYLTSHTLQPMLDHSVRQLHIATLIETETLFEDVMCHDITNTGETWS